jgi:hypothetical protein
MPGSGVLIALGDALGVSVDYLVGDQEMVLEGVEFRKKKITSKREEAQVEARVLHLLERYLMVEELLGLRSVEWHRPREAPYPVIQEVSEADRAAQSLREHWGLGTDPVPNLVELLEEDGLYANLWRVQAGEIEELPEDFVEQASERVAQQALDAAEDD